MNKIRFLKRYYSYRSKENITIKEMSGILRTLPGTILIDVRSPQEYNEGHLPNSINIPLYDLDGYIERGIPNRNSTIITYCQSGIRSEKAVKLLKRKGYKNIYNVDGGLDSI